VSVHDVPQGILAASNSLACVQRQASTTKTSSAPAAPWPGFMKAAVLKRAKHGEAQSAIHAVAGDPNVL